MAKPYSAGGVSIAESSLDVPRRPAACGRVRPFNNSAGLPSTPCSRRHPYCFLQHNTTDSGPGERVRERGPDLEALSPAFSFLNEAFIPLPHGKPSVTDSAGSVWKSRWGQPKRFIQRLTGRAKQIASTAVAGSREESSAPRNRWLRTPTKIKRLLTNRRVRPVSPGRAEQNIRSNYAARAAPPNDGRSAG